MNGFHIRGLNHLGLVVEDIDKARKWFVESLGFEVMEDRGELVFLKVGRDILAIKTPKMAVSKSEYDSPPEASKNGWQSLDHYGFYADSPEEVDAFYQYLLENQIEVLKGPYNRRDGRSVYFRDPCGLVGEYLFYQE